ncbi:hypothetical protein GGR54DRAFT_96838 [Hypoxylon sp. NC1633]|nr:hypothetical protein GGR54DRAFT_96838 [Hypoxylon sp. NC1633]
MDFPKDNRAQSELDGDYENISNEDRDLLRSLTQLQISTSPANPRATPTTSRLSASPFSDLNSKLTATRLSTSASPSTRTLSRSPVNRSYSNGLNSQSRSATPTLLRKTSMNSLHSSSGITPGRSLSRRSSSNNLLSSSASKSPLHGAAHTMEDIRETPAPTAASVASALMQKELDQFHGDAADYRVETMVVLHDACYGHLFSRPRTTKSQLSNIVERPERLQAVVLGIAAAYVRLGGHYAGAQQPVHPVSLPNVPFRIYKTARALALDSTIVTNVHGTQWMKELKIMCDSAESKLVANANEVRRLDVNRGPNASPPRELNEGDLYLCSESLDAFQGALGAVCEAVDGVLGNSPHKRAFVAVRPPGHHCSASHPSGFCWVNNVHVGIMHGILNHGLTHAAIVDFDLHHGDGSQAIAWAHNKRALGRNAAAWEKTSIGYFSLHDINSYPCEDGDFNKVANASVCIDNAQGQSTWNVHLQEWKSDVEFWNLYQSKYSTILKQARSYLQTETERLRTSGQKPKAAIFLSAGFDASEWETDGMQRHKVNVPTDFYARLTRDVVKLASEAGTGVEGRVISVLEGGYSDRALYSGVLSHLCGLTGTESMPKDEVSGEPGYEMISKVGPHSRRNTLIENEMKLKASGFTYDRTWWFASELNKLDATTKGPLELPKKSRNFTPGNYSSPTQASSAKVVDPIKIRRSMPGSGTSFSRPPTPPLPDVPWTVAAHETSKLLMPQDRRINSYKPEELNAAATKARRERQDMLAQDGSTSNDSASTAATVSAKAPPRRSLRDRKPVKYTDPSEDDQVLARGTGYKAARQLGGTSTLPANGASAVPGSGTSLNVRPESSTSVRTAEPTALNVKKTRPPAPGRKESARAPKKPGTAATKIGGVVPPVNKKPSVGSSGEPTKSVTGTARDMEEINTGMKKVKINVLTKEQKEARQKATEEKKADQEAKQVEDPKVSGFHTKQTSTLPAAPNRPLAAPYSQPPHPQIQPSAAAYHPQPHQQSETSLARPVSNQALPSSNVPMPHFREGIQSGNTTMQRGQFNQPPPSPNVPMHYGQFDQEPPSSNMPMQPSREVIQNGNMSMHYGQFNQAPPLSNVSVQPLQEATQNGHMSMHYGSYGPPPATNPISGTLPFVGPNTDWPDQQSNWSAQQNNWAAHNNNNWQAHQNNLSAQQNMNVSSVSPAPATPGRPGGHSFTPTSSIPFAARPFQQSRPMSRDAVPIAQPHNLEATGEGVWEIPNTPQQH